MKKRSFVSLVFLVLLIPIACAVNIGGNVDVDIAVADFGPYIYFGHGRVVFDDATEPGRMSEDGEELLERTQNYAFEGEQIQWDVFVGDSNGIQNVRDVFISIGDKRTARQWVSYQYNDTACMDDCGSQFNSCANSCVFLNQTNQTCLNSCSAQLTVCQNTCERIGQRLEQNDIEANCVQNLSILQKAIEEGADEDIIKILAAYTCTLTVETPLSMYGEYWVTFEVEDYNGQFSHTDGAEFWFLNPEVALTVDGQLLFEDVRPGTHSYSSTLLVGNDADDGSGVQMDMFISGTDFYDSSSSGAACPNTNQLRLGDGDSSCDHNDPFCYFATHGKYDSLSDNRKDSEGYVGINYGIGFNDPNPFYGNFNGDGNGHEILQGLQVGPYFLANVVVPGSEIALTFRLNLPEPCNGDFDSGSLFFWGEAI